VFFPFIGALIGAIFGGFPGALIGGLVGYFAGVVLRRSFIGNLQIAKSRLIESTFSIMGALAPW
jgi:DnaJ like chaperone protein